MAQALKKVADWSKLAQFQSQEAAMSCTMDIRTTYAAAVLASEDAFSELLGTVRITLLLIVASYTQIMVLLWRFTAELAQPTKHYRRMVMRQ